MLCRLCLIESMENLVPLFNSDEQNNENKLLILISKYFQLELLPQDPVSTSVCSRCCKHLYEFHDFWKFVDEQQSRLQEKMKHKQILLEEEIDYPTTNIDVDAVLEVDVNVFNPDGEKEKIVVKVEPNLVHDDFDYDTLNNSELVDSSSDSSDDDVPLAKRIKTSIKNVKERCRKKTKESRSKKSKKGQKSMNGFASRARNEETIQAFMKALQCDMCKHEVKTFSELKKHFNQLHEDQEAYLLCCGKKYKQAAIFVDHIEWHKNPDASTCDICNKKFSSPTYLVAHKLKTHVVRTKGTYSCTECNKTFKSQKCLANHLTKKDHITTYKCTICEKSFNYKSTLATHIEKVHENKCSHICDICGKKFKFKPSFERHVNEHMGIVEPPAQCAECGIWAKSEASLRIHMFIHRKLDNTCKECGKKCVSRTALYAHIRYVHRKKTDLKCKFCDKVFKEPRNLDEHVATHTGDQLYSCPYCPKECRSQSNMYVHIKNAHPVEWINKKLARAHALQAKAPPQTSC